MQWEPYNMNGNKGLYLYKFLSEEFLLKFLKTGKIWFARADKFGDKLECISVVDFGNKTFDLPAVKQRQKKHLISCFHLSDNESLAFWDTYAKKDNERRKYALRFRKAQFIELIKSSTSSLPTELEKAVYGNIRYKSLISADAVSLLKTKVTYASLRKESVYSYEKEFRCVFKLKNEFKEGGYNLNIGKPEELPFDILVNPLLGTKDFIQCSRRVLATHFKEHVVLSKLTKWVKPEWAETIEKHRIKK